MMSTSAYNIPLQYDMASDGRASHRLRTATPSSPSFAAGAFDTYGYSYQHIPTSPSFTPHLGHFAPQYPSRALNPHSPLRQPYSEPAYPYPIYSSFQPDFSDPGQACVSPTDLIGKASPTFVKESLPATAYASPSSEIGEVKRAMSEDLQAAPFRERPKKRSTIAVQPKTAPREGNDVQRKGKGDKSQHKRTRSAQACERCRIRKARCFGGQPCNRCTKRHFDCLFATHTRHRSGSSTLPLPVITSQVSEASDDDDEQDPSPCESPLQLGRSSHPATLPTSSTLGLPVTGLGLQLDAVAENTFAETTWPHRPLMPEYHPILFTPPSEDFHGFYGTTWNDNGKYSSDQVIPYSDGYHYPSQPLSSSSSGPDTSIAWASRTSTEDTSPQNSLPIYLQTPNSPVHHFGDGVWGFARPNVHEWQADKWSPLYQEG